MNLVSQTNLPYDSNNIIIKFKTNSDVFKELRRQHYKSYSDFIIINQDLVNSLNLSHLIVRNESLKVKPLKFDATIRPLPGGVERIFILDIGNNDLNEIYEQLSVCKDVEYAELDYIGSFAGEENFAGSTFIPNDPHFFLQWSLKNVGQTIEGIQGNVGADINISEAWNIATGDSSLIIAVLDSGVPPNSFEFYNRLLPGFDYVNNDNDPLDDRWHGTHMTSIIGATGNNNYLMAGTNWKSRILPLKVLNMDGFGYYSWFAYATIMATDSHARVINLSAGGKVFSKTLQDAIIYAYNNDVIFVTSMMNFNNNEIYYPAAFSNVIAVGATDNRDKRANPF